MTNPFDDLKILHWKKRNSFLKILIMKKERMEYLDLEKTGPKFEPSKTLKIAILITVIIVCSILFFVLFIDK